MIQRWKPTSRTSVYLRVRSQSGFTLLWDLLAKFAGVFAENFQWYRRQSATRTLGMDLIFPLTPVNQSHFYQIGKKWESSLRHSPHLFNRLDQSNRLSSSGGSKHEIWSRAWRSWHDLLDRLLLFAVQITIVKGTENKILRIISHLICVWAD